MHNRAGFPSMPLQLDATGWLRPAPGVNLVPSPNQDPRPGHEPPSLLVLHNISLPPGEFGGPHIVRLFTNSLVLAGHPWFENIRGLRVSAHFLIRRDGQLLQFVATLQRAWHAGVSEFEGRSRCNDFSIGIELEGTDNQPYEPVQYTRLQALTACLRAHHPLTAVRGHEHIAPGRKTDPGPSFDWSTHGRQCGWAAAALPPPCQT